jgi:hypothetical protein
MVAPGTKKSPNGGSERRRTARPDDSMGRQTALLAEPYGPDAGTVLVAGDDTFQHQDRVSVGSFVTPSTGRLTVRWGPRPTSPAIRISG